jgi:hypothetical protein
MVHGVAQAFDLFLAICGDHFAQAYYQSLVCFGVRSEKRETLAGCERPWDSRPRLRPSNLRRQCFPTDRYRRYGESSSAEPSAGKVLDTVKSLRHEVIRDKQISVQWLWVPTQLTGTSELESGRVNQGFGDHHASDDPIILHFCSNFNGTVISARSAC